MTTFKKDFHTKRQPNLSTLAFGKVPPQATDLEEAILGACMLEREAFENVLGVFASEEVFYNDVHQKIFKSLLQLHTLGYPIDLLTVTEQLRKNNELEMVGGAYFLTNLTGSVISSAHVEHHARIVFEKYIGRELIRISGLVIGDAYEDATDVFELNDRACEEFYKILSGFIQSEPKGIDKAVMEVAQKMQMQKAADTDLTGIPSGFKSVDKITNGWQKTDLTVLAARPSVGKTAFALSLACAAANEMYPVLIFSLEMGIGQLIQRMTASLSMVELNQISRPKQMTNDEWAMVNGTFPLLSGLPIHIDDTASITITELFAKSRKMKAKYGIELIIIDYLQLMSGTGKEGNREQEISRISRDLKKLAKTLDVAVIALSQLNRGIEGATGEATRDPKLSDLRESGAIEQDADNVIFISNPSAKLIAADQSFMGKKMITFAKGRNIGLGHIALDFNPAFQKWKDPESVDSFKPQIPDNPRAGIRNAYPTSSQDTKEDLPF